MSLSKLGHLEGAAHPQKLAGNSQNDGLTRYINLKLAALGQPVNVSTADTAFLDITSPLLRNYRQKDQLLGDQLCSTDARIQAFLDTYLQDVCPAGVPRLPARTFVLDRPGLARVMSLPPEGDSFSSAQLQSYRVPQGILHNPRSDRRTSKGIFHIVEDGFPIPADKIGVPRRAFAGLLAAAFRPPEDLLTLPFTAEQSERACLFVSLLLRPLVCPATETDPAKTMEIRFFAPGSLVSNLDFVEGIFGNGGDPYLPENDAALDVSHWTGHSGCVILAPHLVGLKKKDLGLPHFDEATERQRRDDMCWRDEGEIYNGGSPFKIVCRYEPGVIVTIIADNYYGYCKKEVKSQISFATNLYGACEEEHAGGAMAFATYALGQEFHASRTVSLKKATFVEAMRLLEGLVDRAPEGHAIDRRYDDVYYVPEDADFNVQEGFVRWQSNNEEQRLVLRPGAAYFLPSGFRVRLEKQSRGAYWQLVGTRPRGTLCHKPCTVSGGGKSEISKSIAGALLKGPVFVKDYHRDMDRVEEILKMDFSAIYLGRDPDERGRRPILSVERTLGSVIQLLTPSASCTDAHNDWVRALPQTLRQLLFTVKSYYLPEWGDDWRRHFTVDHVNGFLGHELKYEDQNLVAYYLRIGYDRDGSWRIYKLRPDFYPSDKIQVEDDITVSTVLPREKLNDLDPEYANPSVKLVANCERLLFQRPDDAIRPGVDRQAEADIASPGTFLSNFEPITIEEARLMVEHVVEFDQYTDPMKELLERFVEGTGPAYAASSAHPRLVDGKPSKNPRYLQKRPDLVSPRDTHLAEMAARLAREIPAARPVYFPVNDVLAGRRNNPPDLEAGLPPLAAYSPIHYQELPELFMEFISSLTGKSPSTTGFGSEGALTKGPFNALWPVVDLNNALVSAILTEYAGFTTSAGFVGPYYRVDHDISMLMPEVWCRMRVFERDPRFLIEKGYLEKLSDFSFNGHNVLASRLGYRITLGFVDRFMGRIFETPDTVFSEEMLRPEKQDRALFAAGVDAIVEAQQRVAQNYFDDGSVEAACPPLQALLHIMVRGSYRGQTIEDPAVRALFTREALLASDWYQARLGVKQNRDVALWRRHLAALEAFQRSANSTQSATEPQADSLLSLARRQLERVSSPAYLEELVGTIGADPFQGQTRPGPGRVHSDEGQVQHEFVG